MNLSSIMAAFYSPKASDVCPEIGSPKYRVLYQMSHRMMTRRRQELIQTLGLPTTARKVGLTMDVTGKCREEMPPPRRD